jgi:hypothetical protein
MLTAATAALMSGPAFATCPNPAPTWTTISTEITVPVDTACANSGSPSSITITTSGSVVITTTPYTTPAVTIDSGTVATPNTVFNSGLISYNGVTNAVGVELLANGNVGGLDNIGTINLTGTGTGKTGILIGLLSPATTGTFTGGVVPIPTTPITVLPPNFTNDNIAIYLQSGSTINVAGTQSYGIQSIAGTTLNGDIDIAGQLAVTPGTATQTGASGNYGIYLGGTMNGSLVILPLGVVSATGEGANGIVVATPASGNGITGAIANYGIIETFGTGTPTATTNPPNPEGATALWIGANVTGGIYNAGPTSGTDQTAAATISEAGTAPTVLIDTSVGAATAAPVTIGAYNDSTDPGYSFLNRGAITASGEQPDTSEINAISIVGSNSTTNITLSGGIFDSGSIAATNSNDASGTASSAVALLLSYVNVGSSSLGNLVTNSTESGRGYITATVGGPLGGSAIAVDIGAGTILPVIVNYGTIGASATATVTTVTSLSAEAIVDVSGAHPAPNQAVVGTVTTIDNFGTIEAAATLLDNNAQIARAIDLTGSTQNVTITNNGTIIGDIVFGGGQNTLTDTGVGSARATVDGNVYFGGNLGGPDTLTIGASGTLTGSVFEGGNGEVNVEVLAAGTLILQNSYMPVNAPTGFTPGTTAAPLIANSFRIEDDANWSLALTQPFNLYGVNANNTNNLNAGAIVVANSVYLGTAPTPNFQLYFSSFISSPANGPAEFALIQAPVGSFDVSDQELLAMSQDIKVPFLFQGSGATALCTQNIAVSTIPCVAGTVVPAPAGDAQIDLLLVPKVPGPGTLANPGLNLSGYALKMFPYVNAALANDPQLGAGVVAGIIDDPSAQKVYSSFAPDVSGATRATAISLTDSASDIVSVRQRELRMYANQEGDTTLWGQEFAQRLSQSSTPGTIGYDDTGFGFALGMDSGDPSDGRYGGAFTFYSGGSSTQDPVDQKTRSEFYLGTFYTDWRGRGLFLDSQLAAGWAHLNGERYIDVGGVSRQADGQRPAAMLAGGLTSGAIFNFGSTVITPQISLDGLTMREDGYSEQNGGNPNGGGDGFDLRVQPYYASSARTFVGVDLREDINFGDFYLQPAARVGYRYDFLNGAVKLNANFVGVTPISQFSITGPEPAKGNIVLGGGLAVTTGAWSIGGSFDYLRANSGNTQMDGMLTLLGRI